MTPPAPDRYIITGDQIKTIMSITCNVRIGDILRQHPVPPKDAGINTIYYPMSEGELRDILDLKHIPYNANREDVFKANMKGYQRK